jgi:hypothetical protein
MVFTIFSSFVVEKSKSKFLLAPLKLHFNFENLYRIALFRDPKMVLNLKIQEAACGVL